MSLCETETYMSLCGSWKWMCPLISVSKMNSIILASFVSQNSFSRRISITITLNILSREKFCLVMLNFQYYLSFKFITNKVDIFIQNQCLNDHEKLGERGRERKRGRDRKRGRKRSKAPKTKINILMNVSQLQLHMSRMAMHFEIFGNFLLW